MLNKTIVSELRGIVHSAYGDLCLNTPLPPTHQDLVRAETKLTAALTFVRELRQASAGEAA